MFNLRSLRSKESKAALSHYRSQIHQTEWGLKSGIVSNKQVLYEYQPYVRISIGSNHVIN